MFTLVGFYESQDGGAADHYVAAIPDQHVNVQGDELRVPKSMPNIIGKACLSAADAALVSAHLDAPSLSRVALPYIEPVINAVVFGSPPEGILHPNNPTPLMGDEGLKFVINSDDSAGDAEYGLVWFSDGPQSQANGEMFSVRATGAATLSAGLWINTALTFTETLPVGEYDVVGMRARGTNLVAARLVPIGAFHRPGVPAVNALGDQDHDLTRFGRMGVFCRFHSTTPPNVECLGVTDSAQVFILDLIKVA